MLVPYLLIKKFGDKKNELSIEIDLTRNVCPAVTTGSITAVSSAYYHLVMKEIPGRKLSKLPDKPPYRVPLMGEIERIPYNGYDVVSTFSGCGGSCLGYRMAGFNVRWANEFIPAAQDTYRLNHPSTLLDTRDIRKVQPSEILESIGKKVGDIDLFDGSPPCAAFSTSGKRSAGWGVVKSYSDTKQRVDDLFFEYARLLKGMQPKTFVAENVSGLVKGVAKGYFKEILQKLKDCGYKVSARVLDAKWLGVPQSRQRLIFIGVREDLGVEPSHPNPLPYYYSVADALPWLLHSESKEPYVYDQKGEWKPKIIDIEQSPSPTILTSTGHHHISAPPPPPLEELMRCNIEGTAIGKEWDNLEEGQSSDKYLNLSRTHRDRPSATICASHGGRGVAGVTHPVEKRKFFISELVRICSFPDDFQLTGSFAQKWERLGRSVPPVMMMNIAKHVKGILDDVRNCRK